MPVKTDINVTSSGYNDSTLLRLLIQTIPIIGAPLDFLISSHAQKFLEDRIFYMFEELGKAISKVGEDKVDKEFLLSEECYDFLFKASQASLKTRHRFKLKIFAQILAGSFRNDRNHDKTELFLDIIEELSVREIEVVYLLYRVKEERKGKSFSDEERKGMNNDPYWISKNYPQFSKEELEYILPRLEKTGLVKELTGSFLGYGGWSFNPTTLLSELINFISVDEELLNNE